MVKYYDGEKSVCHEVKLKFSANKTRITSGEEILTTWRNEDLYILNYPEDPMPGRLANSLIDGAYLEIENISAWNKITGNANIVRSKGIHIPAAWGVVILLIIAAGVFSLGSIYLVPKMSQVVASIVPYSLERKLGEKVEESFVVDVDKCVAPKGLFALGRMMDKIEPPEDLKIMVVKNMEINAFALPGNIVVVYEGLIRNAEKPEEVLGVLAHELGHVEEKHALEGVIRAIGFKMMMMIIIGQGSDIASNMLSNNYSQDDESEADYIAVEKLYNNRINPKGMVTFLENFKDEEEAANEALSESGVELLNNVFSTHPLVKDRIKLMEEQIKNLDKIRYRRVISDNDWKNLKNVCSRVE